MKTSSILSALALCMSLSFPALVVAETNHAPIEKLISEMAEKPEHHHSIAHYYKDKIEQTKKDLAHHREMRKAYKVGYGKNQLATEGMQKHCDKLISNYESTIKEYEAMAAEHEASALKKP